MSATVGRTVVVELTPAGRAAVAVVLVAGPNALNAVGSLFTPVKPWQAGDPREGRIMLGRWGAADGEELVVCRRAKDRFEVHCHGGAAAIRAVIDELMAHGCRRISWQEWVQQSSPDPLRAAAGIALADAPTARAAAVLLDQHHGALTGAIQRLSEAIAVAVWPAADDIIARLLEFRDLGQHLTTPWRVVLAGAPNVGKSSLLNAIAGYQRAIVSPLPGTTRDVVTVTTAIDGWPVMLADTAGLRHTQNELESAGVKLTDAAIAEADLVVVVLDASEQTQLAAKIISRLPAAAQVILAWNKVDLVPIADRARIGVFASNPQSERSLPAAAGNPQLVSAVTGEGVAELISAIGGALVPVAPSAGEAVVFTPCQLALLESAHAEMTRRDRAAASAAVQSLLADHG